jgi:hypothetical protein
VAVLSLQLTGRDGSSDFHPTVGFSIAYNNVLDSFDNISLFVEILVTKGTQDDDVRQSGRSNNLCKRRRFINTVDITRELPRAALTHNSTASSSKPATPLSNGSVEICLGMQMSLSRRAQSNSCAIRFERKKNLVLLTPTSDPKTEAPNDKLVTIEMEGV